MRRPAPMNNADSTNASPLTSFRQRLLDEEPLIGSYLKTPSSIISEVLGLTPLDAVCLDAEHAPFERARLGPTDLAASRGSPPLGRRATRANVSVVQRTPRPPDAG